MINVENFLKEKAINLRNQTKCVDDDDDAFFFKQRAYMRNGKRDSFFKSA